MGSPDSTYINPLTDFGFKYIFGRDADKEFTISFLNALGIGPKPITDVRFIDKEKKGEAEEDRALIYDLHCQLEDGGKIIVEMQNRYVLWRPGTLLSRSRHIRSGRERQRLGLQTDTCIRGVPDEF